MWPLPQSTACEVSAGLRLPGVVRNNGDIGLSLSGRRTARPQAGYGHHLIDGLLSTNAYIYIIEKQVSHARQTAPVTLKTKTSTNV